jgi:2',3'-cyclic-nucleotide 2'-phosphodiesterase (5'-nucleotidase family)
MKPNAPAGERAVRVTRRDFIGRAGVLGAGLVANATIARWAHAGKAQRITILHTADMHAQLEVHDEFFYEGGKAVFKRRGDFVTLRTMIESLRRDNPGNTLLVDGGDCFQGSAVASLSRGQAIIPLVNRLGYDLMLPGNWEVAYGKQMLIRNLSGYSAAKVCANMFHTGEEGTKLIFAPYQIFQLSGVKIGFVGYNDPLTPTRQPPAYSSGIRFTHPKEDLAGYVAALREREGCDLVSVLAHLGLAQQIDLSNEPCANGVDYILGGDTHERIREPLRGAYANVTEPGAFASFVGRLDIVVVGGKIKDEAYALLEVDPEKYPQDEEMKTLVAAASAPYRKEIDSVVGRTTTPLLRYYVMETPIDNLITDALMWKFRTDSVLSNGFRFCPPLVPPPGGEAEITSGYLWSMLPMDSRLKSGVVTGQRIHDWLERELENVFAKDATKRFGGWLARYTGLVVKFTIGNVAGERVQEVSVQGQPLERDRMYSVVGAAREGDPEDVINRLNVQQTRMHELTMHRVLTEYLAANSPVSPAIEGRALATDAPADLLSQVEGTSYRFR